MPFPLLPILALPLLHQSFPIYRSLRRQWALARTLLSPSACFFLIWYDHAGWYVRKVPMKYVLLLNPRVCASHPSPHSPQHPVSRTHTSSKDLLNETKNETQPRRNSRIRKEFKDHTDHFPLQCFHLSTSSPRDYCCLNSSLNIRRSLLIQDIENLPWRQLSCSFRLHLELPIAVRILITINKNSIYTTAQHKENKCLVCVYNSATHWRLKINSWTMTFFGVLWGKFFGI